MGVNIQIERDKAPDVLETTPHRPCSIAPNCIRLPGLIIFSIDFSSFKKVGIKSIHVCPALSASPKGLQIMGFGLVQSVCP